MIPSEASELRQRRPPAAAKVHWSDTLLDKVETVGRKGYDACQVIMVAVLIAVAVCVVCEGVGHGMELTGLRQPDMHEVPIDYGRISLHMKPFQGKTVGLVLHNSTLHHKFMKDARAANSHHKVDLVSVDCNTDEAYPACEQFIGTTIRQQAAYGIKFIPEQIHYNAEEPEVLFVDDGDVTDSYQL